MPETSTDDTPETLERRDYPQSERDAMDESDFGDPANQAFPIRQPEDVIHAASRLHNASGDESAIKARIKRIAKRKGFPLPQTWQDESTSSTKERAMASDTSNHPAFGASGEDDTHEHDHSHDNDADHHHEHSATRAAPDVHPAFRFNIPITLTRSDPDWTIEGQMTSDAIDHYGTVFDYESSKKAALKWRGNIREMHQNKAVGRAVEVTPDDASRCIYLRARISRGARDTWEKILDGTLSGFSISVPEGRYKKRYETRGGKSVPVYYDHEFAEVSVVDSTGSPECDFAIVRADGMTTELLDTTEEEAPEQTTSSPGSSSPLERVGARVSADTRAANHQGIAHILKGAVAMMQNCGPNCDNCMAAQKLIDPDGDGDIDIGSYDDPDQDSNDLYNGRDADMSRSLGSLEAAIERILEQKLSFVERRLQGIAGTLARSNPASHPSIESLVSGALTRAFEPIASSIAEVQTSLSEVRTEQSVVRETVARIDNTPMPGAPIQNTNALPRPVEKRLATDPYQPPQRSGSAVYDAIASMSAAGQLDTIDKQVDAMTAGLIAQQQGRR